MQDGPICCDCSSMECGPAGAGSPLCCDAEGKTANCAKEKSRPEKHGRPFGLIAPRSVIQGFIFSLSESGSQPFRSTSTPTFRYPNSRHCFNLGK